MAGDVKAKKHPVLQALKQELAKGFIEDEFTISNHKFKLHTLNEDEETWSDSFVRPVSLTAAISSRKAPRLACSISALDGVPVDQLFQYPDDMKEDERKAMDENAVAKRYWVRDQMLYFLAEESFRPFINELAEKFNELEKRREEALKAIPKS